MENKKRKDRKTSSSLLVGVLVCFVLIAVYGIVTQLKVSYALPDSMKEIDAKNIKEIYPEQPKNSQGQSNYSPTNLPTGWDQPGNKIVGNILLKEQTKVSYIVDIFCLQHNKGLPDLKTPSNKTVIYKEASDQSLIDEGINYIVLKAYNDNDLTETTTDGVKKINLTDNDYYDAQAALWVRQYRLGAYNDKEDDSEEVKAEKAQSRAKLKTISDSISASSTNSHAKKIFEYVDGAEKAYNNRNVKNNIKLNGKVEFKPNSDGTYYETEDLTVEITKAPNTEFTGFKLTLNNDSNVDIAIVDSSNNVIKPSEYDAKIASGQSFKFRIKKEDLPVDTTVGITGEIKGNFEHMGFKAYEGYLDNSTTPNTALQIVLVPVNNPTPASIKIEASVTVPDTGAGYTGYIYIIGAIVLIVGLSIIYVNTKVQQN